MDMFICVALEKMLREHVNTVESLEGRQMKEYT